MVSISALDAASAPANWRIRRLAISGPGSLCLALPVKTMADGEYTSSSFSFDSPERILQNFCTSARTSSGERLAATAEEYQRARASNVLDRARMRIGKQWREQRRPFAARRDIKSFVAPRDHGVNAHRAPRRAQPESREPVRVRVRQRLEEQSARHAENGRVRADADRERKHDSIRTP